MSLVVAGDIAIAHNSLFQFEGFPVGMLENPWCFNLEGAVIDSYSALPEWGLFNSLDSIDQLSDFTLAPFFLGNNHIHDIPDGIQKTLSKLDFYGLASFGAGVNLRMASEPSLVDSENNRYVLLGFGWPVIGCVPAGADHFGVHRFGEKQVLRSVRKSLQDNQSYRVVIVVHGNYEFELYAQPGHRKLARKLIDLGAYAVIFHHPHIVGPVERYKGRTIAHSLGNWAFSYGRFCKGRLRFPESSFHQIAVELGEQGDMIHHARFEPPCTVRYERTECVDAADFSLRPEFEGFDDSAYLRWFKTNRIKRKGLPIYRDANDSITNRLRDWWVYGRQVLIDTAAKNGLKPMRSGS